MSIEAARSYIRRIQKDEIFNRKVRACKDAVERKAFLLRAGYDFTTSDIEIIKGELTNEELDSDNIINGCR